MAGQTGRVAQDVEAIAETREHLSNKLTLLDRRVEETVGKRWAAADFLYRSVGSVQKLIVVVRVGVGVVRFVRRRPWFMAAAAMGAMLVVKGLSHGGAEKHRRR